MKRGNATLDGRTMSESELAQNLESLRYFRLQHSMGLMSDQFLSEMHEVIAPRREEDRNEGWHTKDWTADRLKDNLPFDGE